MCILVVTTGYNLSLTTNLGMKKWKKKGFEKLKSMRKFTDGYLMQMFVLTIIPPHTNNTQMHGCIVICTPYKNKPTREAEKSVSWRSPKRRK